MAAMDFSKFQFTAEQVRNVRDLIWDKIVTAPELSSVFTIYSDVVTGKQVGFIGDAGLVITKDSGCGSQPQDWKIGTRTITWNPQVWEAYIRECYADLESTMAVYSLKKGSDRADLTDTDYEYVVAEVLGESIKQSIFAIAFFGDTTSSDVHLNLIDGLYKQMQSQIATNPAQKVEIEATNVIKGVLDMYAAAPAELANDEDAKFYVSQAAYVAILSALSSANAGERSMMFLLEGGKVSILGKEVMVLPLLDKFAPAEAKKLVVFTAQKYLGVGVDGEAFTGVRADYDPATKYTHLRAMGKMDAKLTRATCFVLGTIN